MRDERPRILCCLGLSFLCDHAARKIERIELGTQSYYICRVKIGCVLTTNHQPLTTAS